MKMKIGKRLVLSGMAGMLCLGMGTAMAIDMDSGIEHDEVDYNKDGKVSHDEMMAHCNTAFLKMDHTGKAHSMADYNKDGKVSRDEMMAHCETAFLKMDKRGNKLIEANEWSNDWFLDQ